MMRCSAQDLAQLGDLVLKQGAELRFRASGTSMQPVIQDGQMIRVAPLPPRGPRGGDILFYRGDSGRAVIHRLMGQIRAGQGDLYLTKGDGCADSDAPVGVEQVLGWVTAVESADGRIVRLDRGPNLVRARLYAWLWQAAPYLRRMPGGRVPLGGLFRRLLLPR